MNGRVICAAAAAFVWATTLAGATTLSIVPTDGVWTSSKPSVSGIGTTRLNWGVPAYSRQSGYRYEAEAAKQVSSGKAFSIGTFTHENFGITGPALENARLEVSFQIAGLVNPITTDFLFLHNETLNNTATCANGVANGEGINAGGCADQVTAALNTGQARNFVIDGTSYSLEILGFQSGGRTLTEFWTAEGRENSAELMAIFTANPPSGAPLPPGETPPIPGVPVPASGLLFATFLFALRFLRAG